MKHLILVAATASLAGCYTLPADHGREEVNTLLEMRGYTVPKEQAHLQPTGQLSLRDAVSLALLNNSRVRAEYAKLGFGVAELYTAARVRNPILSLSRLTSDESGARSQNTVGLVASVTDMVTLGARKKRAGASYATLKQKIGAAVLETAINTQHAYYQYVAAEQHLAIHQQIASAAQLSHQLAQRFDDAGNMSPRELALSQAAASEATLISLNAKGTGTDARAALAKWMGVSVTADWRVDHSLPIPITQPESKQSLLQLARINRLDISAARTDAAKLEADLGTTKRTRWLGELDLGVETERETDGSRTTGPELGWTLPVFTQNRDETLKLHAQLEIAIANIHHLEMNMENDIHLAIEAMRNARTRADEYKSNLIPARQAATERAQEEQNFMLIGVFELLASKQDEYDSIKGYVDAVRDYWLARTDLARAVGTSLPTDIHISGERLDIDDYLYSRPTPNPHHHHHGAHSQ